MIRAANNNDINTIIKLGELVIPNFEKTYNLTDYINSNNYIFLVYENNSQIIGFILVLKNIEFYEIEMIVVNKNFQNNGIGTLLMNYFEEEFLKAGDSVLLEVAVNNTRAIALYRKFKYEIINVRKKYYNNIDAYVMKKVK